MNPAAAPFPLRALVLSLTAIAGAASAQDAPKVPAAAAAAASAPAQARPGNRLDRVEVDGRPSDESVRRNSTASKLVFSREEIEKFGDTTVGEVLKRLPGVTTGGRPGRGGDVRMRGMGGGYTQILVNGERMPPGFSLDQLPPDQVERIEVMRAPTAEFGARAVAGTINVVLREALQKRVNDLRLNVSSEKGALRPGISWTRNDKLDDNGGAYNLSVNAMRNERFDDANSQSHTLVRETGRESTSTFRGHNEASSGAIHMNGRFQLRTGGPGETLTLMPILAVNRGRTHNEQHLTQSNCDYEQGQIPPGDPAKLIQCLRYDFGESESSNRFEMARLHANWSPRLSTSTRSEWRLALGTARGSGHSYREEFLQSAGTAPVRTQDDTTRSRDRSWSLGGKISHAMENEHSLVGGLEGEGNTRSSSRVSLQNGLPSPTLADFGDNLQASTQRVAAYLQDEWNIGKQWSFYAGLRGESIATHSNRNIATGGEIKSRSTVWTPLLHGVWKFDENSRDQIRASLTRSYRAPNLNDLIAPRSISGQYPCFDARCHGTNEIISPDREGNPNLKPELATGLEIGYENYLTKGGLLSANVFYRHIEGLMRNRVELETVSWSDVPRWVSRPRNIGDAKTMGIELEAKFRLDQVFGEELPGVNMRTNLSVFRSQVDGIPGPYNRLDEQPRGTLNLGADYRLKSMPLNLGASWNYTPANQVQQTAERLISTSKKSVIDAFALWAFNMNTSLRVSATNLAPLDYTTGSINETQYKIISSTAPGRSFTLWSVRLEMKL